MCTEWRKQHEEQEEEDTRASVQKNHPEMKTEEKIVPRLWNWKRVWIGDRESKQNEKLLYKI